MAAQRLDLNRTWADALAMLRANLDAVSALAGMFVLLPGILISWFLPERTLPKGKTGFAEILAANQAYMTEHWPWLMLSAIVVAFGSLAISAYLLDRARPTVTATLTLALTALPFYLFASAIQTFAVLGGVMLFILPGIYLVSRFLCIAAVAAVEGRRRPMAIIVRSFQVTQGNGWRIILLLAVILLVALVVSTVFGAIIGIASSLLLPPDLARLLSIIAGSLVESALAVSVTLVGASVYRQFA